jgi:hypothetical protein
MSLPAGLSRIRFIKTNIVVITRCACFSSAGARHAGEDAAIPDAATYAASDNNTLENADVADTISYAADATSPGEDADVADTISCAADATSP